MSNFNTTYKLPNRKELLQIKNDLQILKYRPTGNTTTITKTVAAIGTTNNSNNAVTPKIVGGTVATDNLAQEILTTNPINFGLFLARTIFEELKCIVTIAAPTGTTFKIIDQNNNIIIPSGEIVVDKVGATTANINKRITTDLILSGIFENTNTGIDVEIIFIKKVWTL